MLQGVFAAGYAKVYGLIADSGWKLVREGEDEDEEDDYLPDVSGMQM